MFITESMNALYEKIFVWLINLITRPNAVQINLFIKMVEKIPLITIDQILGAVEHGLHFSIPDI